MSSTILFFIFIPFLAFVLLSINLIFAPHNPYQEKKSAFECGFHSFLGQNRTQFSISFFIFALLFLLFDLEILLVYPYIVSAYTNSVYGLFMMLVFFIALTIGLGFELGKKALNIDSRQLSSLYLNNTRKNSSIIAFNKIKCVNINTSKIHFIPIGFLSLPGISLDTFDLTKMLSCLSLDPTICLIIKCFVISLLLITTIFANLVDGVLTVNQLRHNQDVDVRELRRARRNVLIKLREQQLANMTGVKKNIYSRLWIGPPKLSIGDRAILDEIVMANPNNGYRLNPTQASKILDLSTGKHVTANNDFINFIQSNIFRI